MDQDHSLGRHVEHDPLSRNFAHPAKAFVKRTTLWAHHAPVLAQGRLGSCTGNALAQCLNTDYFAASRPGRYLDEHDAIMLYSKATHLDKVPGYYPPEDTGSSGNAVCKAGRGLGYLSAWGWTFSFISFLAKLQTQPMIVGTAFYADMEDPDSNGYVEPTGNLEGGHEYVILGVNYELGDIIMLNSWSDDWGVKVQSQFAGRFRMKMPKFEALLADQGDATIPIGKI